MHIIVGQCVFVVGLFAPSGAQVQWIGWMFGRLAHPTSQMSNTVGKLQYRLLLSQCQPETFGCFFVVSHFLCVIEEEILVCLWILKSRRKQANTRW